MTVARTKIVLPKVEPFFPAEMADAARRVDKVLSQLAHDASVINAGGAAGLAAHLADHANPHVVTKAQVGLSLVENTALSTWAGSANIATVGTITSGVWHGTPIAAAYLGAHTHAASDITSGTFADARIAQSNVTQHQAALAIAYTQLTYSGLTAGQVLRATSAVAAAFGALDLANASAVTGLLPWGNVSKTGSSLADLTTRSAADLSSGTLSDARFPATLPALSGVNLTALNASALGSGNVPYARMAIGSGSWDTGAATTITITRSLTVSGTLTGALTGNASTATALQNARTVGGVSFDGTANITVATATGGFTVSGGDLALGANNLTLTGSIGATGARSTKGWFTDLEVTNAIVGSITGNAATATSAAKWTTARNLAGNSVDGSGNVAFANKFIVQGTVDAGLSGAQFLGALGTGILLNTTTTGVLSIAVAGDFPTLNQNTTGSAATLLNTRTIWGQNFNGSANVSGAFSGATTMTWSGNVLNDLLFTDATYDIGKSGATSPRDIYFTRQLVARAGASATLDMVTVGTSLNPTADATADIGSGTKRWRDLWISRQILFAQGGVFYFNTSAFNTYVTESALGTWDLVVGGTNTLRSTSSVITLAADLKFTDATYDIGKSGATRPRDGFFSRKLIVENDASAASVAIGLGNTTTGFFRTATGGVGFSSGGTAAVNFYGGGTITFSGTEDTNLYRSGANALKTDGSFTAVGGLIVNAAAATDAQLIVDADAANQANIRLRAAGADKWLIYRDTANGFVLYNSGLGATALAIASGTNLAAFTGAVTAGGSYTSGTPSGGTAQPWKFGSVITGEVGLALNTTSHVQLDVNGTLVKLALIL